MRSPIIFRREDCLSPEAALYWKDLLYRAVKIGTEIEFAVPKGVSKKKFMPELESSLCPTRDISQLGQYGVLDVIDEHCGVEVQVIGRQPYYPALSEQYTAIMQPLLDKGVRARATCGLHFHLLALGLGEPVPEIILANIWNITRRYSASLRFITSCGEHPEAMCRRRNYNSHLEMVRHTPSAYTMREIQQLLKESKRVPEHQNFINLEHVEFDEQGDIKDFHLEFRFPDADLTPTGIVSKTFLFLAILLKAVEMSQYGVIHVGRVRAWKRNVEILDMLSNNDGNLATSDTSAITEDVIEELRVGSRELLELLKPVFVRLARAGGDGSEDHPAFEVLSLLAETPISLLRCSGRNWQEIETVLQERASVRPGDWDKTDYRLIRLIELAELTEHTSLAAWKWEAAREIYVTPQELDRRLELLDGWRGIRWDGRVGTLAFLS